MRKDQENPAPVNLYPIDLSPMGQEAQHHEEEEGR